MTKRKKSKFVIRKDGLHEAIRMINGKRVAFRGKSDRDVEHKMMEYQEKLEKGRSFNEVESEWERMCWPQLSPNTLRNYSPAAKVWLDEFEDMSIKEITAADILSVLQRIALTHRQKTVNAYKLVINLIMRQAIAGGDIQINPVDAVTVPKGLPGMERSMPTEDEIEIVKQNVNEPYGLLHFFIMYSGCRKGEALAMQLKDIDLKGQKINITKSLYYNSSKPQLKGPKTQKGYRKVPLLPQLVPYIPKGKPDDFLFPLESKTTMERHLRRYRKKTGLTCTLHQLRHAYATFLYEAGVDVKQAQYLLGHASIKMTMDIYTHIRQSQLDDASDQLNAYFKKKDAENTARELSNYTVTTQ